MSVTPQTLTRSNTTGWGGNYSLRYYSTVNNKIYYAFWNSDAGGSWWSEVTGGVPRTSIYVDTTDGKWYDHEGLNPDGSEHTPLTITAASSQTVGSGTIQVFDTQLRFEFDNPTESEASWLPLSSGSGPTVTDITIVTPYELNDGVNNFWVDGEFVTNDTVTASDCTLYNDFQSYANSNITIVGNKFGITKSGTGVYGISVGGAHATVDYVDDSWTTTISSNSSSRSTNSQRIKDVLAKIPDDIKFHRLIGLYSPAETGVAEARGPDTFYWRTFDQLGWTKDKRDTSITYTYNYRMTNPYNVHRWYTDPFTERHRFEVREYNGEINWRFSRYKWFNDLSLNVGYSHNVLHSPWNEVGANSWCTWIWSYDSGETRHGVSNYDSWLVDERFFVKVTDWVYYQEPEGDDEGPDGNPPNNYPPSDNPPSDPPDDPDPPKHQYPGPWAVRRRSHSFW